MATQLVVENLNVTGARLPAAYEAARLALASCDSIDECKSWADKAQALASYARQADDDTLHKTAIRIQSRAVRRAGELLQEFKSAGGRPSQTGDGSAAGAVRDGGNAEPQSGGKETGDGTGPSFPRSQREAAEQAGMSERQLKTAVRVAKVPSAHFEAAIESDEPPTVTRLADMGRQPPARADEPVPPGFQAQIQLMGHARRLAEFAEVNEPGFVGMAVAEYNRRELRGYVARCRRWLAALAPLIRERHHGV